jgi:hypothetical protein
MNLGTSSPSRRTVLRGAAWSAPAIVVASAAPAYAGSPVVPPSWTVTPSNPLIMGTAETYPIGFSINVSQGSLGTLTCTFTAAAGGFIGGPSTGGAFSGWTGTGGGAASGDQRESWTFQSGLDPFQGPIVSNFVGTMAGIAQPADLPMSIVFTASADGSQRAFTMTGLGGSSAIITADPAP